MGLRMTNRPPATRATIHARAIQHRCGWRRQSPMIDSGPVGAPPAGALIWYEFCGLQAPGCLAGSELIFPVPCHGILNTTPDSFPMAASICNWMRPCRHVERIWRRRDLIDGVANPPALAQNPVTPETEFTACRASGGKPSRRVLIPRSRFDSAPSSDAVDSARGRGLIKRRARTPASGVIGSQRPLNRLASGLDALMRGEPEQCRMRPVTDSMIEVGRF